MYVIVIVIDFQKFVVSTLTKIKYDINGLMHTVNASHLILDNNQNNLSSLSNNTFQETFILDEIFPIKTNDELEHFEKKIENDKQFRFNIVGLVFISKFISHKMHLTC